MQFFKIIIYVILSFLFWFPSVLYGQNNFKPIIETNNRIISSSQNVLDTTRHRLIPVQTYMNIKFKNNAISNKKPMQVVIINHGYGAKNIEYSSIANYLAKKGYFVISIQHDLDTDLPLARTGNLYQRRKPLWDKGVLNILFIEKALSRQYPFIDFNKVILIGHSNGGDISMLFAELYPHLVQSVISLDSLRMPFPRNNLFPILSIRANDTIADPGVLPHEKDYKKLNMTILKFTKAKHIDLCDRGNSTIKKELNLAIDHFLKSYIP